MKKTLKATIILGIAGIIIISPNANAGYKDLEFEQTLVKMKPKLSEEVATVKFHFVNNSNKPIRFVKHTEREQFKQALTNSNNNKLLSESEVATIKSHISKLESIANKLNQNLKEQDKINNAINEKFKYFMASKEPTETLSKNIVNDLSKYKNSFLEINAQSQKSAATANLTLQKIFTYNHPKINSTKAKIKGIDAGNLDHNEKFLQKIHTTITNLKDAKLSATPEEIDKANANSIQSGKGKVDYIAIQRSCSCLSVGWDKDENHIYQPGEKGYVFAKYGINPKASALGHSIVKRSISLYDFYPYANDTQNNQDSLALNAELEIPVYYSFKDNKSVIEWKVGEKPIAKEVTILLNKELKKIEQYKDFEIEPNAQIKFGNKDLDTEVKKISDTEYKVYVKPKSTAKEAHSYIALTTNSSRSSLKDLFINAKISQ